MDIPASIAELLERAMGKGAYGQELRLGDIGSRYGKVVAYDSNGETIAIIDDTQVTFGSVVAESIQAPNIVSTGIPVGTTVTYYVNANTEATTMTGVAVRRWLPCMPSLIDCHGCLTVR